MDQLKLDRLGQKKQKLATDKFENAMIDRYRI